MISCFTCRERLNLLLEDALSSQERAAVESHLESCAQCQNELEIARNLRESLSHIPPVEAPENLRLRVRAALESQTQPKPIWKINWRPASFAWAGGATVLALGLLLIASNPKNMAPVAQQSKDTASEPMGEAANQTDDAKLNEAADTAPSPIVKSAPSVAKKPAIQPKIPALAPNLSPIHRLPPAPPGVVAPVPVAPLQQSPVSKPKSQKRAEAEPPKLDATLSPRQTAPTSPIAPRQTAKSSDDKTFDLKSSAPKAQPKDLSSVPAPATLSAPPANWFAARLAPVETQASAFSADAIESRQEDAKPKMRGSFAAGSNAEPAPAPPAARVAPAETAERGNNRLADAPRDEERRGRKKASSFDVRLVVTPQRSAENARLRVALPENLHFFASNETERIVWQGNAKIGQPISVLLMLEKVPEKPLEIRLEQIGANGVSKELQSQKIQP